MYDKNAVLFKYLALLNRLILNPVNILQHLFKFEKKSGSTRPNCIGFIRKKYMFGLIPKLFLL